LATEDRDTHSKKLKGFISDKFTTGNTNGKTFVLFFTNVFFLCYVDPCSKL
jgi:hypothetical protein